VLNCDDLQDPQHRFTSISQLSRKASRINSGSLTTFKSRLTFIVYRLIVAYTVHVSPHHIPASAPEVTTLRFISLLLF